MLQKRIHSLLEALANTFSGILISFFASFWVYPLLGMQATASAYALATAFFTCLSILRGYIVRRVGNYYQRIILRKQGINV